MPIYEYECPGCQTVHEVTQKMSDPPMATCPTCGGAVKKLISLSAFHLKGTGWYNTDYKKPTGTPAPSTAAAAATETKAETKTTATEDKAVKPETPAKSDTTANPSKPKAS